MGFERAAQNPRAGQIEAITPSCVRIVLVAEEGVARLPIKIRGRVARSSASSACISTSFAESKCGASTIGVSGTGTITGTATISIAVSGEPGAFAAGVRASHPKRPPIAKMLANSDVRMPRCSHRSRFNRLSVRRSRSSLRPARVRVDGGVRSSSRSSRSSERSVMADLLVCLAERLPARVRSDSTALADSWRDRAISSTVICSRYLARSTTS